MEFVKPEVRVTTFSVADIILASGDGLVDKGDGDFTGGGGNFEWGGQSINIGI